MGIVIIIVAMVVIGLLVGAIASLIWKDNKPFGTIGDYVIAIVTAIVFGLIAWYVIPIMGFSNTIRWISLATEPLFGALFVLWLVRKARGFTASEIEMGETSTSHISRTTLDSIITRHVSQGYRVAYQTEKVVQLVKSKTHNHVLLLFCFLFGLIPLIGYAVQYGAERDKILTMRIREDGLIDKEFEGGSKPWANAVGGGLIAVGAIVSCAIVIGFISR